MTSPASARSLIVTPSAGIRFLLVGHGLLAGDDEIVDDVIDAAGHPGGVERRVVLGPGADVPGQRHRVQGGVDHDVAVVHDQRVAVQRVLDAGGDVARVGVGVDADLVLDVPEADQPADGGFCRGALRAEVHGAGQRDVAVARGRLDARWHGDVPRQGVVGGGGQLRVVAVVAGRELDHQVVVDTLHPLDALRGGRGFQVLRIARHGAVERYLPVQVLHGDVRRVDQRVEVQL